MAEIVGSVSQNSSYYKYYLDVSESNVNTANNTSVVTVALKIYTNYSSTLAIRYASATHTITIDGTIYTMTTGEYTLGSYNTVTLGTASKTITHNSDGTKSVNISASSPDLAQGNGWGPYSGSASGTFTLTSIPRYAKFANHSISSTGLNSIKVTWSADSTCDAVQYSLNGGSWVATSGTTYTITVLSPNTSYSIKTRIRRKDSQLWTESSTITGTTKDIGKISSVDSFNHGNNTTLVITNPSGSSLNLVMKIGSTQILSRTVSTGSNTISFSDTELDNIYKLYGSGNTLTATFVLTTAGTYTNTKTATITLTGNQKTAYTAVSGSKKRAKVYVGVNGTVKKAVVWIGNNGRKRCI